MSTFQEKKENLKQKINKQMEHLHSASQHANVWYEMGYNMHLVKDMIQLPIQALLQKTKEDMTETDRLLKELHNRVKKLEGKDTEAARSLVQMSREGNKRRRTGGRKTRKTRKRKRRKTRKRKRRKR
jgi:cell division septum initiation protein DivIVA